MVRLLVIVALAIAALAQPGASALAQDEAAERSRFVRFVEERISSPNMQIRLIGLEGALSRDVSLDRITVSDEEGVWLSIEEPRLVWQRAALLRGELIIEQLSAESLEFVRTPAADESLPSPEARSFALPDLPVAIRIDRLELPRAEFAEQVFGLAAVLSLEGAMTLADQTLDAELDITRLDGAGGQLALDAEYGDERLDLTVRLTEPADGVVANLLNLEGRPPVSLSIEGGGPLDALDIDIAFDVDGRPILAGGLDVSGGLFGGGTQVRFTLEGPLADILPERERAFFGDRTELRGEIALAEDGATRIEALTIESGALSLDASGRLLPDGFLQALTVEATLAPIEGNRIALPASPRTTVQGARIALDYGGTEWRLSAVLDSLRAPDLALDRAVIEGGGTLADIRDPAARSATFDVEARLDGFSPGDPDLAAAIGPRPTLSLQGDWQAGAPANVRTLVAETAGARLTGEGTIADFGFDGRLAATAADLSVFSGLAGRDLSGRAEASLEGTIVPLTGAFDLVVDARATSLAAGDDLVGELLSDALTVSGGVERAAEGLTFSQLEGRTAEIDFAVDGTLSSEAADLNAAVTLADLAVIDARSSGTAGAQFAVTRPPPDPDADAPAATPYMIDATAMVPDGTMAGQPVEDLRIAFDGETLDGMVRGDVSGSGSVAGEALALEATVERRDDTLTLGGLSLTLGEAALSGLVSLTDGLVTGSLTLDADDIAGLAALALVDASGAVQADIALAAEDGDQDAAVTARVAGLAVNGTRIGQADVEADLTDIFGAVGGEANIDARSVSAGPVEIVSLQASARTPDEGTVAFEADARLDDGTTIATEGTALLEGPVTEVRLRRLVADTPYGDVRLTDSARFTLRDGTVEIAGTTLSVAGGRVAVSGAAGERLDLNATLSGLPLALANTVRPDLGAAGTLSGTIAVAGTPAAPRVDFDLSADGVSAAPLRQAGIDPLAASAAGRFADDRVTITGFAARNGQGLDLSASGTVPLSGGGLNLDLSGSAPLALAEPALAGRGTRLDGTLRFEGRATGALGSPSLSGLVSLSGGTITDPGANIELTAVNLLAGLEGDRLVIRNGSARVAGGGGVTLSGQIGLAPPFPADLAIDLAGVRYTDGRTLSADLSADLAITGPLAGGALIAGQVDIARAEIVVPDGFGGGAELLDVRHVEPGAGTLATLRRIDRLTGEATGGGGAPLRLDVTVNAPNQIFVRGRGLDVELGGSVRLGGSLDAVSPVGSFQLIRGRLSVLNQRLDFTSGRLTLTGDLDPLVDLVAETSAADLIVTVRLVGPASDLRLELSSSPPLPDDEIFARLLFGSDVASLSPIQLARLADAASALAGGDTTLTGSFREALGIDDLDLVEGDDGGIGVRAGRYLTDNVYLELEAQSGGTETTINLDITDSLTARGSADTEGDTSLGIFFERDY